MEGNHDDSLSKDVNNLFPVKQLSNGKVQTIYGTNDTSELLKTIPSQLVEMKLDEVLDAVKTVDATCDFDKCKTKTKLMGQDCGLCSKRFCFKHGLPEVHGCGQAVKKKEQKEFRHPTPLKTIRQQEEVTKARTRLDTKLKDMNQARKAHQTNGKKVKRK